MLVAVLAIVQWYRSNELPPVADLFTTSTVIIQGSGGGFVTQTTKSIHLTADDYGKMLQRRWPLPDGTYATVFICGPRHRYKYRVSKVPYTCDAHINTTATLEYELVPE